MHASNIIPSNNPIYGPYGAQGNSELGTYSLGMYLYTHVDVIAKHHVKTRSENTFKISMTSEPLLLIMLMLICISIFLMMKCY